MACLNECMSIFEGILGDKFLLSYANHHRGTKTTYNIKKKGKTRIYAY